MDLDRAKHDTNELKILEKLIKHIKKSKDIHLFLTLDDFEDWLRFHFVDNSKNSKTNFYRNLGYSDNKNFKSSTNDLYSQILNKGGCIENAEKYFCNITVFAIISFILSYFYNFGLIYIIDLPQSHHLFLP
ncbi:hypothetical protein CINS5971_07815 [Campylobacter insulaenigrae]|nr:hypothetical protein [Campylobacter insulaenigrae]MCR6577749.1 hypothetical protein [Campylobacter insulaenigrae]